MTADDRRSLDDSGYLVLPLFPISPGVLADLESRFECAGQNAGHALRNEPFERTLEIALDDYSHFAPFTSNRAALDCVEHLLGLEYKLGAVRARSSNPFALALHPFRRGPGASACRVLWLLDDFAGEGAAALRVVPGSHRLEEQPGVTPAISLSPPAGSAVVLHGGLWSAEAPNPGNRHQRTLLCEYFRRDAH